MNTSKQVNVMIGLMFLTAVIFAANVLNEPNRAETAREHQIETFAERGAEIFVANCRNCHGLEGKGNEEGAIAPALNNPAFLILGEDNEYGAPATAAGVAQGIRDFLGDTITCGRKGTYMPLWGENFGGSLSEQQIDYVVTLITEGRWDIVEDVAHEHDSHLDPVPTREDILVADASGLALTGENCGQYDGITALPFRTRDPFAGAPADGEGTPEPGGTTEPGDGGGDPADALVQGVPVGTFYTASCSACHGANREGLVGPALTPDRLIESDDFYFDTIQNGRAGTVMPAWGQQGLTDDDINALVQWIKNVEP